MPRIARIVLPGYPHHLIQRGNNKQAIFFDDKDKEKYLYFIKKYSKECGSAVHTYCLMNNHIHLLVSPEEKTSLAKTMQKVSLTYTQYINQKYKRTGRLWECRFYSSLVNTDEYFWAVCRYIEHNPVRSKIVKKPGDYKWSGASIKRGVEINDFLEPIWENESEKKKYKNYLDCKPENRELEIIRESTFKGLPIGDKDFLEKMDTIFKGMIIRQPKGRPKKNSIIN